MAVLLLIPHQEKRIPGRAQDNKRNQKWSQFFMGTSSPVQCALRVTESKSLLYAEKGGWELEEMGKEKR
jgi:hypothetical protein